jgi:hypothetical protein
VAAAALVLAEYWQIHRLRAELAEAKANVVLARAMVGESLPGMRGELQRTIAWLNEFYKSRDGLQRPEGLWIHDQPDIEGMTTWVFDLYLRLRLKGVSEADARRAVEDAIRSTEEWRARHAARTGP